MSTMTAVFNNHGIRSVREPGRELGGEGETAEQRNADFPRSASYTFMPALAPNQAYNRKPPAPITIKGSFSEDELVAGADHNTDVSPPESQASGRTTPSEDIRVPADSAQDLVAQLHKNPKISITRLDTGAEDETDITTNIDGTADRDSTKAVPPFVPAPPPASSAAAVPSTTPAADPDRLQASSFAKRLSRRLSYTPSTSSSREPSPAKSAKSAKSAKDSSKRRSFIQSDSHDTEAATKAPASGSVARKRTTLQKRRSVVQPSESKPEGKPEGGLLARSSTLLRRKSLKAAKPSTPTVRASMETTERPPAVPALPKSFSTDRLPYASQVHHDRQAPMPRMVSGEKLASLGPLSIPRKRDELWTVFRSLDADYTKFQSKSSALKANVVRASLLPFLRNYADHPSSFALRAEDIDRRANILNKWWTALLEMLHGKNNQSISGTDRPAILDALSGIMERPEWRLSPSPLCPLSRRNVGTSTPRNKSSTSLASGGVDFLTESVHHNVRNMFVQNLNAQMAFVVDRMSLRNASASLVTFCGKATAYAFFFCPGIAEVLVRLWDTPTDNMRRVLAENDVGKFENIGDLSAKIVSAFPPAIQQLGFVSVGKLLKHLRTQIALPIGTANIQWYGYWLERWLGRESDLFYAFVKQFHILVTDYLPPDSTKRERMCVPGLLLVHAQILANLDSTIHRDAGQSQGDGSAGLPTIFDDVLADPDAIANTLPLPPTNAIRIMAENRLIMLIRDFLSERATEHPESQLLFASSFTDLLQACARRTSVYNHSACYTLCDFLEEALHILVRYEHTSNMEGSLINTKFWVDVCKKMISSQNTMTEVRLYAFLFTIWSIISGDADRKADFCLELLLDEAIFERTFNHWCPMVRAYYMRLICWRVGRYDGDGEESPRTRLILETLLQRLRSVWSHYLWTKQEANKGYIPHPSTVPSNPAPGRRLLIIRMDAQIPADCSILTFDNLVPRQATTPMRSPSVAWKRNSTLTPVAELVSRPSSSSASSEADGEVEREGGLRGFFRSVLGGSKNNAKARERTRASNRLSVASAPPGTRALSPSVLARSTTDDHGMPRLQPLVGAAGGSSTSLNTTALKPRSCSFKFSLEFHGKHHALGPMRLIPPRLPMAAQIYVQSQSTEMNSPLYMSRAVEPLGDAKIHSKYAGRALAEWTVIVGECQSFFERRKNEGMQENKHVETPTLGVEIFSKRPA